MPCTRLAYHVNNSLGLVMGRNVKVENQINPIGLGSIEIVSKTVNIPHFN